MDTINFRKSGVNYQFWLARELADQQAATFSPVYDLEFVSDVLPGHDDLWYISPRARREGALDAACNPIPAAFFASMERTQFYSNLAKQYAREGRERFGKHCAIWLSIDPLGLAGEGVPDDEYSTWAAATVYLCENNPTLKDVAEALRALYLDWNSLGDGISFERAMALAENFARQ